MLNRIEPSDTLDTSKLFFKMVNSNQYIKKEFFKKDIMEIDF